MAVDTYHEKEIKKVVCRKMRNREVMQMNYRNMKRHFAVLLAVSCLGSAVSVSAGETDTESAIEIVSESVTEPASQSDTEAVSELSEEVITEPDTEAAEEEVSLHGIRYAKDYKEIYEALKKADNSYYWLDDGLDYIVEDAEVSVAETAAASDTMNFGSDTAKAETTGLGTDVYPDDYSSTNLRELGVDEADVVKTDGRYLYILKDYSEVLIVRAEGSEVSLVSVIKLDQGREVSRNMADLYIDGDILCVAAGESFYNEERLEKLKVTSWYYSGWEEHTILYTYDISDRAKPEATGCVEQDGYYQESRKVGDYIYLYSQFRPYLDEDYENSSIIPKAGGSEIAAGQVAIPNTIAYANYLIVSGVDLKDPSGVTDVKALVSGGGTYYVSPQNLYAMIGYYRTNTQKTEIVKFHYEEGKIEGIGACDLKGYVNNTFSVDEYEGNLRVLTTYTGSDYGAALEAISNLLGLDYYDSEQWVRHNALFVLDESMKLIGKVKGIAKDEEIRSARFFGDTAYFVTFRNTDPLFTADLSDPTAPKLTGELKVSGFSSYLHPYGDGKLLGIGYEADEETGRVTGLKLSMFDVSDPLHVTETDRMVVKNITWCPAIENYKCILADASKNLIGFYYSDRYMVYRYDEEQGFSRVLLYDFFEDMINDVSSYDTMRGLYIGDELYLAGADYVIGFDMANGFGKNVAACGLSADS